MPFIFGLPKLTLLQTFGLSVSDILLSPRKIGFGKKDITSNQNIRNEDELNKNLEDLLQIYHRILERRLFISVTIGDTNVRF